MEVGSYVAGFLRPRSLALTHHSGSLLADTNADEQGQKLMLIDSRPQVRFRLLPRDAVRLELLQQGFIDRRCCLSWVYSRPPLTGAATISSATGVLPLAGDFHDAPFSNR